jgi:hypothetical protein
MNLNLDDRLAPNAVETFENQLMHHNAVAIGGDWNVRHSQEATDAVEPCYPAERLAFEPEWPPKQGVATRLGSGTGERGTMGPAVMWRMQAHIGAPRYPYRLGDGTLLKSAADSAWWQLLQNHMKVKLTRIPLVVGNYHSHPGEQAEFRIPDNELALMREQELSLL